MQIVEKNNCLLCDGEKLTLLEIVDKDLLVNKYKDLTGVDFSYLINVNLKYYECGECKLRFFDPLITGDEVFYKSLQQFDWYYLDEKDEYLEAVKHISPTDKVLDVGSGKGTFFNLLQTNDYIGLDSSQNAIMMAAKEGVLIKNEMVQDYADSHPSSFDVVVSFQVLEHVPDPKLFLQAKVDALKVGGKLIIAVPSEDSFLKFATNNILNMPPHHVTRWPDKTLYYIAERYNLQVVNIYHESLQDIHKSWFVKLLISNIIPERKLIAKGLTSKLTSIISTLLAKILVKGLKDEMLPHGHTVMAVYQKK